MFKHNLEMNAAIEGTDPQGKTSKYTKLNIDINKQKEYLKKIESYMSEHKPYLNSYNFV